MCHFSTSYTKLKLQLAEVTHWQCALRGIQDEKQDKALCILIREPLDAHLRKNFSDPRFLHLPIHRKVLKSLTWDICFCHKQSFDAWLFFFFSKNSCTSWLLLYLFGTVLQCYSRSWFPGYSPLNKIKLSTFRLCVFLIDNYYTMCVFLITMLHLYRVEPAPRGLGCQD